MVDKAESLDEKKMNWARSKLFELIIAALCAGGGYGAKAALDHSEETRVAIIEIRQLEIQDKLAKLEKGLDETNKGVNLLLGRLGVEPAKAGE